MSDNTSERPATSRGDREGRRRDVLAASRHILDEEGWDGFSIRAIASRSGVSTGAVYQWFAGKDEIFSELYAEQIQAGVELLRGMPVELGFERTVRLMVDWAVDLYERLGRYELELFEATRERDREVSPALAEVYLEIMRLAGEHLVDVGAHEGVTVLQSPYAVTWFWASCIGVAERLLVSSMVFPSTERDDLLAFTASSIARGLTVDPATTA